MLRRSFLSLSALSAVPVLANAAEPDPQADWHETVSTDALKFTAETEHGKITLHVDLIGPDVTALHLPFKNPQSTIVIRKSPPLPLPRLPLRRRRHRPFPSLSAFQHFSFSAFTLMSSDIDTARRMSVEITKPNIQMRRLTPENNGSSSTTNHYEWPN